MSSINFSDVVNLTTLLESLCNTFKMFKAHEQIENKYIMRRLREKLQALSITNRAVCNCHKDSRLTMMLRLLQQGHSMASTTDTERLNFGLKLRQALEDFTQQFLPHMEEEEEVTFGILHTTLISNIYVWLMLLSQMYVTLIL